MVSVALSNGKDRMQRHDGIAAYRDCNGSGKALRTGIFGVLDLIDASNNEAPKRLAKQSSGLNECNLGPLRNRSVIGIRTASVHDGIEADAADRKPTGHSPVT